MMSRKLKTEALAFFQNFLHGEKIGDQAGRLERDRDTQGPDFIFHDRIAFLDDNQLFYAGRKLPDQLLR